MGKAVIATNKGGPRDFISPREGVLVDTNNVEDLAQAMIDLLRNTAKARRLGEAARTKSLQYSWDNITPQYVELYEQLAVKG